MNLQLAELTAETTSAPPARRPGVRDARAISGFAVLFALSVGMAVAGRLLANEALALIGGYGVVIFGIGGAPLQLHGQLNLAARLSGALLVGLSVLLIAGGVMADIRGLWDPVAAAAIVGGAAVVLHLIGLSRLGRPGLAALRRPMIGPPAAPAIRRRSQLSLLLTLAATAMWLAPALSTHDAAPGYWGMLRVLSPFWFAGMGTLLLAFAIGRGRELPAALAALSFGLATTLTPALVYAAPREQTAAKQMQLTQYMLIHHHVHVTAGIYRAFSTMFGGVAALSQLLGIHGTLGPMSLWQVATYWPVLLVFLRIAELRFLAGRLLNGSGRRWTAVMLVLLVDSLGADYYSPQSIGYVMAIAMVGFAIRGVNRQPLRRLPTLTLLTLAGVALAPTHELSPYMAAGALVILALFRQAPWWSSLPVGLPALAWAWVVRKPISHNFSFSALFNLSNFRPPVTVATPGLHRLSIVGIQSHLLLLALLLLIVLGAVGFFTNFGRRWAWAYGLCPIVGISFIAINPYGNEGIFRATLFAIPWMAILAMKARRPRWWPRALSRWRVSTPALAAYLILLLGTFIPAAYAMDGTSVLASSDVAMVRYMMHLGAHNAFTLGVGSASNPTDGANSTLNYTTLEWSQVANVRALRRPQPDATEAAALADRYGLVELQHGATGSSPLYLVWSRSSMLYTNAYGLQSEQQMRTWLRVLRHSPFWRLVDRSQNTYLFKLG